MMGYFSNGSEGIYYEEEYCSKCVHWDGCAVWLLHLVWNYDAKEGTDKEFALDSFIPRDERGFNGKCLMYVESKIG